MKIISFSLWGPHELYNKGAIKNALEAKSIYPDWKCRYYVSRDSPVLKDLQKLDNCQVITCDKEQSYIPSFWRFFAIDDPDVEYCIFRDCDSIVNTREKACVDEWIASQKIGHVMRDYPYPHSTEIILAGMWGLSGEYRKFGSMRELSYRWLHGKNVHNKYVDQEFLGQMVWPNIANDCKEHGWYDQPRTFHNFPEHLPMSFGEYVGQPIDQSTYTI